MFQKLYFEDQCVSKFHGSIIYTIASKGTQFCIEIAFTLLHQGSLLYTYTLIFMYFFQVTDKLTVFAFILIEESGENEELNEVGEK